MSPRNAIVKSRRSRRSKAVGIGNGLDPWALVWGQPYIDCETLVKGLTYRPTDDIDFVNEVPPEIRSQRTAISQVRAEFGLTLGHVQSHYLPANWINRRQFFGDFGGIRVYLVDVYDVFVSKLS